MDGKMHDLQLLKLEKSSLMVDTWLTALEMLQISVYSTVSMSGVRSVPSTVMPSNVNVMPAFVRSPHFSWSVPKNKKYQGLI